MSSIKGYPSQKKLNGKLSGFDLEDCETKFDHVTVQNTGQGKRALDTTVRFAFRVGAVDACEANSTVRVIKATSHAAQVGDFLRFESGAANPYAEVHVLSVPDANTIILADELATTPILGDQFYILRYTTQRVDDTGAQVVLTTPGPVQFVQDGADVEVEEDTVTPANSKPLPIKALDGSGNEVDFATEAKQDSIITELQGIAALDFATETTLSGINGKLPATLGSKSEDASLAIVGPAEILTGSASSATDIIASTDVSGYQTVTVQLTGTWSAQVRARFSNDNVNWIDSQYVDPNSVGSGGLTNMNTNGLKMFQVYGKYFKLTSTSYSSGTIEATAFLTQSVNPTSVSAWVAATQSGTWRVYCQDGSGNNTVMDFGASSSGLRVSSLMGNATGAADFNAGAIGAQTLRTAAVLANQNGEVDYGHGAVGAQTPRVASVISNGSAAADFNAGAIGASTLRAAAILANQNGEVDYGHGAAGAQTPRVASQIGNATGAADFNAGAIGAQTLRTASVLANQNGEVDYGAGNSSAQTQRVVIATDQAGLAAAKGRSKVDQGFNDYTSTSVTTSAYTELIASTSADANKVEIFDSSGEVMILAVGAAASEVDQLYIFPGGNGPVELNIPSGSRVSIKAKTATASVGLIAVNLYS